MTADTSEQQQQHITGAPSARLSYSNFEVAIKAFLHQMQHHSPWSYVEYSPRRGQPLQGYLTLTKLVHSHQTASSVKLLSASTILAGTDRIATTIDPADQLLLDELTDIPDGDDEEDGTENTEDLVIESSADTTLNYLSVNYHIVFSPSYQVPVLYFNAYRPGNVIFFPHELLSSIFSPLRKKTDNGFYDTVDGAAIPLEEIYESLVPEEWRSAIRNAGLNGGISQQDHPVLNTPYFYMHPCETVPLMETVLQNNNLTMSKDEASQPSVLDNYIMTWLSFTGQAIGVSVPTDVIAAINA
ncbi:E2-like conjugating enzyme atg10 [Linnemannia zychae]|nr:E2-like conjugating enzyme atg10 [Linnemannia zychae]